MLQVRCVQTPKACLRESRCERVGPLLTWRVVTGAS